MKLHFPGEKGSAICEADGLVSTTFAYRDVPFSDGSGVAKQILVGVCDRCGEVVAIPPQSTPAIKAAREKAGVSVEAVLPAVYLDALDLACYRIDPGVTQEFRKRLLLYYVHRCAGDEEATRRVASILREAGGEFREGERSPVRRRLSLKVSRPMARSIERLMEATRLNRTDLFKALVVQIGKDIVEPERPAKLAELRTLAAVAAC
jgi:hypothetical protein